MQTPSYDDEDCARASTASLVVHSSPSRAAVGRSQRGTHRARPMSNPLEGSPTKSFGPTWLSSPPLPVHCNIIGGDESGSGEIMALPPGRTSLRVFQPIHRLEGKSRTPFARVGGWVAAERNVWARVAAYRLCTAETGTMRRHPSRGDPGDRQRQQSLRDRRKAAGWRRVSIWLSPEQVARLTRHGGTAGLGRTVKRLLVWADPDLGAENELDDGARRADDRAAAVSETVPPTPCQDGSSAASGTQRSPLRDNDREGEPKRPEKS